MIKYSCKCFSSHGQKKVTVKFPFTINKNSSNDILCRLFEECSKALSGIYMIQVEQVGTGGY
jgi:hypothetical protein